MINGMIRNIASDDIDALVAIERACFAAGYADKMMSAEDFADVLDDERSALFCAVDGGVVAGYAFLIMEDGAANFDSLAVSPHIRARALARSFFAMSSDIATTMPSRGSILRSRKPTTPC